MIKKSWEFFEMQAAQVPYVQIKVGAKIRATVSKLTTQQYSLVSRVWEGEILETSPWTKEQIKQHQAPKYKLATTRAVKIHALPYLGESMYCHMCGQYLEREITRTFGYGPGCADKFGIPQWDSFTPEQIDEFRQSLAAPFKRDLWVHLDRDNIEIINEAPELPQNYNKDWDVKFTIEANEIIVVTTPDFRTVVRGVPGWKWDTRFNVWRFPATPTIALQLKNAFDGYRRRGSREFLNLIKIGEEQQEAQSLKVVENLPPIPHLNGNGGWQHQRQAFAFLVKVLTGRNPYDGIDNDDHSA